MRPWLLAARPKTLPAALAPVMLGSASAAAVEAFAPMPALLALLFAVLMQITCNFANDYGDFMRGADTPERLGPARAVASGWVAPQAMRRAVVLLAAASFCTGLLLVFWGGWWLIGVGTICLLACLAYTGGPFPLAYNGLGDVFVIVFFGFAAVLFTAYVQCGFFPAQAWVAAPACGLLAANILVVNNARDMETDARAGKRTTVVRYGRGFARAQYALSMAFALALPAVLLLLGSGPGALLPLLASPVGIAMALGFCRVREPSAYNAWLGRTAAFLLAYAALFSLGILFGK
jgi:1,4-dihydroxy-2-naphthoate octaprenyltransferase